MKETLTALWNGYISPFDQCGKEDPQIRELIDYMARHENTLVQELTSQQKVVLAKYIDCVDEYTLLIAEQAFCQGFCLAGRLWTEALS